ncbi:MAG: zinc ribbon-containing protein [Cycloclasticus sp.]
MTNQRGSNFIDVLGAVYEGLFEEVVEKFHQVEEVSAPVFHRLIDEAKADAVKLEKITNEEGEKLAQWLKQDIQEVAQYMAETGRELEDWLGFEKDILQSVALEKLLKTADKATVQMLALKTELARRLTPHTGEVTGAGTLVCDKCGEKLHFHKAGKVPPCPKCHGTLFHRGYK